MEIPERKEITKGYFVGDTVILMEETEETKRLGFEKGVVGIVSKNDTKETLKGWKVVDYEKNFKEAVDKMNPEYTRDSTCTVGRQILAVVAVVVVQTGNSAALVAAVVVGA